MQHICKSHENFSTKERNFLFYDYKFHNVLARNQCVEIIGDINSRTPELFLAGVCSKALVVGISATAGLYTNIGNYDLKYLKSRLGDSFIRIKDDALVKLQNAYNEATQGYNQVSIKTKFIGTDTQKEAIKQFE
ncbi:MAG: hypothetical protein HWQ38_28710 [Nostoc sp. NMS7]|uniref:hypothetical protein n=1 Tax=Nostoc sp. NMS7 TaxID=2815391 RepID=UPI0025FF979A|nr:hypothetical protein [Nostoc sp. NMS7]MBN3950237.1 hypothetical protein [Nostoc sp. NMS7]